MIEGLSIRPDDLAMLRRYRALLLMFDKPLEPALDLKIEQARLRLAPDDEEVIARLLALAHTHGLSIDDDIRMMLGDRLRQATGADR